MHVVFRTDASIEIGTGHVMRCLTLANALKAKGVTCEFVCRLHKGNLVDFITDSGFLVHALPEGPVAPSATHADWLGTSWQQDAAQTQAALNHAKPDWLIVDHYALDAHWETAMHAHCGRKMVIDDLADRPHECDLLLDQNLGRQKADYAALVNSDCHLLIGPSFALLRPEFAALRAQSLSRRRDTGMQNILITMGGVDQNNVTNKVLEALKACALPEDMRLTVVMGLHAPWLAAIREEAKAMPWQTEVKVNVSNMAQLMANSDLAIGAAGSTSWERCCLGLPSITLVLAENQRKIASKLSELGAAYLVQSEQEIPSAAVELFANLEKIQGLSDFSSQLVDGFGLQRVQEALGK